MKKVFISLITICVLAIIAISSCYIYFLNKVPQNTKTETNEYILFQNVKYGESRFRNILDICLPKNKTGEVGLMLYIHGGGWVAGDKDGFVDTLKINTTKEGFVTASINYRYLSKSVNCNDIMDDITRSLIKIKEIANEHNIQVNKMWLEGGSAGAHLSLLYAYSRANIAPIKPVCVVSLCGPTNLCDDKYFENNDTKETIHCWFENLCECEFDIGDRNNIQPFFAQQSPIYYVNENTVPTLICHGKIDTVVPFTNATALDEKLTEFGITHDFIVFENSGHGLENDQDKTRIMNDLALQYARTYLN